MRSDLRKHTLHLREGDWAYLDSILAPHNIPTSLFIRNLVSRQVEHFRARETTETLNLSLRLE